MKKYVLILCLCYLTAGCGTLFSGFSQKLKFDSNVEGVSVFVDGEEICKTPCATWVRRSSSGIIITAKKDGYENKSETVDATVNIVSILNFSSVPSWTTDAVSGGVWRYMDDAFYFNMNKEGEQKKAEFIQDAEIRRFVLYNYANIRHEIMRNVEGEYTKSLGLLTNLSFREIKAVAEKSWDEVSFIHSIIAISKP